MSFIQELKRRNVLRVGIAYAVTSWLLIQVADTVFPLFGFSEEPARIVVIVLSIGFVPALVVAWVFEFTADGLQRDSDVDRGRDAPAISNQVFDRAILLVLVLALSYFAVDKFLLDPARDEIEVRTASERAVQDALDGVRRLDSSAPSIAVLPFASLSSDPDQEFFADGLAEEILNLLTQNEDLKVIARTSSFAFRNRNEDARSIGEKLGVTSLLSGSVRQSGDQLRISVALIDASDGSRIWADSYDRTMTDIFVVQETVATDVIDALQVHVGANPTRGRPTENMEAYALFLKARIAMNLYNIQQAEGLLLKAVDLDPEFAEAHELLSFCYWNLCGEPVSTSEAQRKIFEAAARAIAINPELVFARVMYLDGEVHTFDVEDLLKGFERAVRRDPTNALLLDSFSWYLLMAGYLSEALVIAERYLEIDPISLPANIRYARALYAVGRTDDAFAAMDVYNQLGGGNALWVRGRWNVEIRQDDSAVADLEADLNSDGVIDSSWIREFVANARDPESGLAYMDRRVPEIIASIPDEFVSSFSATFSLLYLHFGYPDRYLESFLDVPVGTVDSIWDDSEGAIVLGTVHRRMGFTGHPRYLDVAERFGLIEAWEQRGPPDFCEKIGDAWVCR